MEFILLFLFSTTPFRADRVEIVNEQGSSIVYLLGNVEIEQDDTKITCGEAWLNETRGVVLLKDSVLIKDQIGEIQAQNATYYLKTKIGILTKDVKMTSENQIISADSLNYDGEKRFIRMSKNVRLEDKKNRIIVYGGEGWYDLNEELGSIIKEPKVEILREDKSPIIILAREFLLKNKEGICCGYDSVKGFIDSITLFCDTLCYDLKKDLGILKNPVVIEKNNRLKGLSGEFGLKNQALDFFKVNSGIASYWTNQGAHNIIEGSIINIIFKEGRAYRVLVEGNPKGRLYLKEENAGD